MIKQKQNQKHLLQQKENEFNNKKITLSNLIVNNKNLK